MTHLSQQILDHYQRRMTKKQKEAFRSVVKEELGKKDITARDDVSGRFIKSHNLIIGDLSSSELLLTAHYDTAAVLPFPNMVFPKNLLMNLVYGFALLVPIIVLYFTVLPLLERFNPQVTLIVRIALLVGLIGMVFLGKANKHTANDNTSGVITLLEILHRIDLDRDKVCFIFFDNEEIGMFGSSSLKKKYKRQLRDKLVVNFDCVSDGDHLLFAQSKKAQPEVEPLLKASFKDTVQKKMVITKSATTYLKSMWALWYSVGYLSSVTTRHGYIPRETPLSIKPTSNS